MIEIIKGIIAIFKAIAEELKAGKISEEEARARCMNVGYLISETETDKELAAINKVFEDDND